VREEGGEWEREKEKGEREFVKTRSLSSLFFPPLPLLSNISPIGSH
jgi:hypothetical protein